MLKEVCTADAVVREAFLRAIFDSPKAIRTELAKKKLPGDKLPLNDDLRRGIRLAYLRSAVEIMKRAKEADNRHAEALDKIIKVLKEEQGDVDRPDYGSRVTGYGSTPLETPPIDYSNLPKVLPAYQGENPLRSSVQEVFHRELNNRFFGDEDLQAAGLHLFGGDTSDGFFITMQAFFAEIYKTNDRVRAAFDGAMLVQMVTHDDVRDLKTLPEETQQRMQTLLEELETRIAAENAELAEKFRRYFDIRIDEVLTGIKALKDGQQSIIDNVNRGNQAVIDEIRKSRAPTDHAAPYEPQRVVGAVPILRAFEGRLDKLAELRQSVINGNRLTQVCGPVGRGKTALATRFINDDSRFGSIVFVTFRGQDSLAFERIISLLLQTLPADQQKKLRALQEDEADLLKALSTLLRTCIAEHKTLIVLDNLEDALEDGCFTDAYTSLREFVAGVLQLDGHACQLLVTSREPLDITSLGRDLGGVFDSAEVSLEDGLPIEDGIALLRHLGDGKSGLKAADNEVLVWLVKQCDGIPLVLTNVAGELKRRRTMTVQRLLTMSGKLDALRHEPAKTLYESLTAEEQAVMQVLAVFGKAVPELAVRFLLPELDTEAILLELETTYAVQFNAEGESYSYSLRPIDQEYAYEQLADEERKVLHNQAAAFYRELRKPEEDWRMLKDLQPQLDEFAQLVQAEAHDEACRVLLGFDSDPLLLWGNVALVRDLHLQLLDRDTEKTRVVDKILQARHLGNLGSAYRVLGEVQRAIEYFEQALTIARKTGYRRGEGTTLEDLGNVYRELGDVQRAIECYEQALAIAREIGHRRGEGARLGNLGSAYRVLGKVQRAIEYFEQALAIARETGDRRNEGTTLGDSGNAYRELGDVQRAIECYEQALTIAREIGYRRSEGTRLTSLGSIYRQLGDVQRAIEHYEQALTIAREIGYRRGEGAILGYLGLVYHELGELQRAIEYYEQALTIVSEIGYRRSEGVRLSSLGSAYRDLGDVQRAIEYYEKALTIDRETGYRRGEGIRLGYLGNAYHELSDVQRAIEYCEQALTIARETGYRRGEGVRLGYLGNAYRDLGDLQRAVGYYQEALEIVRETSYRWGESEILSDLGLAFYKLGDRDKAIAHCKDALAIARLSGYRKIESSALDCLGLVYRDAGELDAMLACGVVALTTFEAILSPKVKDVAAWLSERRRVQADFVSRLQALFIDGDTILSEVTGQNYTFFQDASADMPERVLIAVDEHSQQGSRSGTEF